MKTEQEIKTALGNLWKHVCHNQHERQTRRNIQTALKWVLGEVSMEILDTPEANQTQTAKA